MDNPGLPWTILDIYGESWKILDNPEACLNLDNPGQSWTFMENPGESRKILDNPAGMFKPGQSWGKALPGEEVRPSVWQSPPLLLLFSHRGETICG